MHVLITELRRSTTPTGLCRHAANLAQCLAATEQVTQVTLVVGDWQKPYFETAFALNSEKIQLVGVEIKNSALARNAWYVLGLPKLANQMGADLVHLAFPLPFLRSLFKVPVVATVHDLYPYEFPENFGYPQVLFNQLFLNQCVSQVNGITCVSQTTLSSLRRYFPSIVANKQVSVIYNSVDFSHCHPYPPHSLSTDRSFILSVAQHRKNKNLDLLIQVFALLLKQQQLAPVTQLIFVGSPGPETENLQQQIQKLGLQSSVLMLSALKDDELCWLYQHADLLVIPSSTEGFCIPLVEALSLSCRVVCSDIPVLREVGSTECTYFQLEGDPVSHLATALQYALSQSRPAVSLSQSRFSNQQIAQQYLTFYTTVTAANR